MVSITCYGGANEIGGNEIIVEVDDTCLSFDFGTSFGRRDEYFEEYLKPRPGMGLPDMLYMGLLPPLDGIYRRHPMPTADFWERWRSAPHYRQLAFDGGLLFHAHVDHSGYISFLDPEIPVHSIVMTAVISKAMQDGGQTDFEREVRYAHLREPHETVLRASKVGRQRSGSAADRAHNQASHSDPRSY